MRRYQWAKMIDIAGTSHLVRNPSEDLCTYVMDLADLEGREPTMYHFIHSVPGFR
jgi:hypothetical protein